MTSKRKQPFTYEEFKEIYSKVPKLCVDILVQTDKGILLTKRGKGFGWEGMWHLPGGTVLYKERIAETVLRVVEEELGIEVEPLGLVGFIEYVSEEKQRGFGYTISLVVAASTKADFIETEEKKFFEHPPQDTIKEQRNFLENILNSDCGDPDCDIDHDKH